jgi:hypothetical protein
LKIRKALGGGSKSPVSVLLLPKASESSKANSMKWFKLFGQEVINDDKLAQLSDAEMGVWFRLLAIASIQSTPGSVSVHTLRNIYGWSDDKISHVIRRFVDEFGFLTMIDDVLTFSNWKSYQSEYERTKQYREKRWDKKQNATEMLQKCYRNATEKIHREVEVEVEVEVEEKPVVIQSLLVDQGEKADAVKDAAFFRTQTSKKPRMRKDRISAAVDEHWDLPSLPDAIMDAAGFDEVRTLALLHQANDPRIKNKKGYVIRCLISPKFTPSDSAIMTAKKKILELGKRAGIDAIEPEFNSRTLGMD